jgi:hypothetical protein
VGQKEVWRANYLGPWTGGVLTTAGNLVAQGTAAGDFRIYRADSGQKLGGTGVWGQDSPARGVLETALRA